MSAASSSRLRPGRLLWTVAVAVYFGTFFRNFLADAIPPGGRAAPSPLLLALAFGFVVWMGIEYYFGAPFFQSGLTEPSRIGRALFALFVYPWIGYAAADCFWWRLTQLPLPPAIFGLAGLALFGAGSFLRLGALFTLTAAARRKGNRGRGGACAVIHPDVLGSLRFQRTCRHPRYLGTLLQLAGIALALGSWGALALLAAIGLPLVWAQARHEDRLLRACDPAAFDRYAARVPLLIPLRRSRRASG